MYETGRVVTCFFFYKKMKEKDMRIIQTFWSGGHDPLECGYGWSHAEHNLMSWALSCHSLRGHYSQVELYTDQRGYDVLIGKLAFAREKK